MKGGQLESGWVSLRPVEFEFRILRCRKCFPFLSSSSFRLLAPLRGRFLSQHPLYHLCIPPHTTC
jgi:hypothetical protein